MATNEPPTLHLQIDPPAGTDDSEEESSYHDIMMIGRTGFGKSTVGNKLLGINPETCKPYDKEVKIMQWDFDGDEKFFFEVGEGKESVTKSCKVLSNEKTKDRVLDTRGFADSEMTQKYGVIRGNLQSFRWILQAQRAYKLRFSRVLYFFPKRGPPERADGTLQEEIKVMHGFFGQKIFDVMVIVVTNYKRQSYQKAGFGEDDIKETEEVFRSAFMKVTETPQQAGQDDVPLMCPPVVYIPYNEDHEVVMNNILSADVISDAERLTFSPEFPIQRNFETDDQPIPPLKYDLPRDELRKAFQRNKGKVFCFEDRCTRCALKLVHERQKSGEELPVAVIYENGDQEVYDNSYCHPYFIPKYSQLAKIVGGIAHIFTLGVGKLYELASSGKSWPGFMNTEEKCVHCGKAPEAPSCCPVNQWKEIKGENIKVDHSRKLDTVKLLEEAQDAEQV